MVDHPNTSLVPLNTLEVSKTQERANLPRRRVRSELTRSMAKIEYLVEPEYMAMVTVAEHSEHRLLLRLLWETGLRITEALTLTYTDIYPDGVNIIGKGSKQRFVPCQAPVLGELLRYRETHREQKIFQKITTEVGALKLMRRLAKKSGIEKRVHPHLFRHSFAINFIQQTGNPFALQDIGGWSDMETIKIYMRLAKEAPKQAIQRMHFPEVR
jgi:integrase/recombinase XerD